MLVWTAGRGVASEKTTKPFALARILSAMYSYNALGSRATSNPASKIGGTVCMDRSLHVLCASCKHASALMDFKANVAVGSGRHRVHFFG